ncbi:GNAT family N-acetyltransferase [Agromyces sp. NPDC057865]|uniref:GNAT family N-acetyltransferase n=1 Tax=Agromyces sp. NPDC057865 TaxID=3346267 RepID=UPI00366E2466
MTDAPGPPASVIADAEVTADAADARAGLRTRPARPDEIAGVLARFEATWGVGRGPDHAMIQAIEHAGATVLVAVADDEGGVVGAEAAGTGRVAAPLGAALGFLGWNDGLHIHSHMNAVDPAARGRGIGLALKLRQRAICLAHGVDEVRWTYDPLIRRNARMNLVRLGAEVIAFLPDFYGELDDAITGTDRSDRFEVRWRLDSPRTRRALARGPLPEWRTDGHLALVADYEQLRATDPEAAVRLRAASRAAFAALARDPGLRVELDAAGDYVLTHDDPDREA